VESESAICKHAQDMPLCVHVAERGLRTRRSRTQKQAAVRGLQLLFNDLLKVYKAQ
jgi:hypothetical protein